MLYRSRNPRPPLDSVIEQLWAFQSARRAHALERVLPTGAAQLIVNLAEDETRRYDPETGLVQETASGSVLVGVQSRYHVIDTAEQEHVAGVVFKLSTSRTSCTSSAR